MSNRKNSAQNKALTLAAMAVVGGLSFQPLLVSAAQVNPRDFQAYGYDIRIVDEDHGEWRKANGGEILGGFAGADDQVNVRTGEVRHR